MNNTMTFSRRLLPLETQNTDAKRCAANKLNLILDAKHKSSYHAEHEQAPIGKARPNPLNAGRGLVDAFGVPRVRCIDQYGHKAAG